MQLASQPNNQLDLLKQKSYKSHETQMQHYILPVSRWDSVAVFRILQDKIDCIAFKSLLLNSCFRYLFKQKIYIVVKKQKRSFQHTAVFSS